MHHSLPWTLFAALCLASPAEAFTTRVHMALANDVRESLIASPDGRTIRLGGGEAVVRLSADDARAIRAWPLAFRAGAIGPDNFVFPAMTDLTHGVGLRPYDQCEDLYGLAVTDEERAYAMGCFLHGASDAVAHHLVNGLTGETFTLNPIAAGRAEDYANVARHIVSESMIQEAWLEAFPDAFRASAMLHAIPEDFVARAVMDPTSPVWARMTTHALPKWEAIEAADPDALLYEKVSALDAAPAEYLALLPLYVEHAHLDLDLLVPALRDEVAALQDPSTLDGALLGVGRGPDGQWGTEDDATDCSLTCPTLYATYFTLIALLEPRPEYGGTSAADDIVADLHGDLDELMPAYIDTISATSAQLNGELVPDGPSFDLDNLDLASVTGPLDAWGADLIGVDWDLIARTVLPAWLLEVEAFLAGLGIPIDLGAVLESLIEPRLDAIRDAVLEVALAELEAELAELTAEIEAAEGGLRAEFQARFDDAAPAGASSILDDLAHSGLYLHSFNLVSVTLANHQVMLPAGDSWAGEGPASFDASHTVAWTQAAVCPHLVDAVFPLGTDRTALYSLAIDGEVRRADVAADAPIECHDGDSLTFAAAPDATSCAVVDLDGLLSHGVGSLSRAFPPAAVGLELACRDLVVDGLPEPTDPADPTGDGRRADGGCGCAASAGPAGAWWLVFVLVAAACGRSDGRKRPDPEPDPGTTPTTSGTWSAGADHDLLEALGQTVWHAQVERPEGTRVSELRFDAAAGLVAEVVNPWGPGRERILRSVTPSADGRQLHTTVTTPAGWPEVEGEGSSSAWTVTLAGSELRIERDGSADVYASGPEPAPTSGLTAIARAFEPGGWVDAAFCSSGAGGFDYETLFDFARGGEADELVAQEIVAGVYVDPWYPVGGAFDLAELQGFDRDGGTAVDAPQNWTVRYVGTLAHPGGDLAVREADDAVEDGVWVWLDTGVGFLSNDWFLEVHGFWWPDGTADAPSAWFPAGDVPFEVILVRCDQPIVEVELEIAVGGGGFQSAGNAPSAPDLSTAWFPETF